jgi:hypothetical protein
MNNRKSCVVWLCLLTCSTTAWNIGSLSSSAVRRQAQIIAQKRNAVAIPLDIPVDNVSTTTTTTTTTISQKKHSLSPQDAWIAELDYEAFRRDVNALGKELLLETGEADVEHLNKILSWRDMATLVGLSTVWLAPNVFTVAALSLQTFASFTMSV